MNEYKRIVLQQYEELILSDVTDPSDIVTHLLSKNVITNLDRENILNNNSNKTAMLLKVLYNKENGSPWFEEFISALKQDYDWISEKLYREYYDEADKKLSYYLSGKGHVPPLPQHNVTRRGYVDDLRKAIAGLKREDFLVVHGMPGWGKTCLVVDALNDIKLLEEALEGCVYWISVGDVGDEPDDLQCSQLQKKLCDMVNLPINNQQEYFTQLKRHFSLKPNISALLVLDKVKSSKVVDALNVGCKVLVTTQNTEVVKKYNRKQFFHIKDGFSESESVKLLQDFVYDNRSQRFNYKDTAIKIHHSWKGHPMAIGLIGGELYEFKEESQRNISRWNQHVRHPHQGDDVESRRNSLVLQQLSSVIELTTSKLPEKIRNCFEMLVVLVEDTNITVDVLKILWGLNEFDVRSTLDHLYRRSLVIKKVNTKDVPVYGIHEMVKDCLIKITPKSDLKEKNKDLILKYMDVCNRDFANLPQDNYIFSYLCHHIEWANMWEECRDNLFTLRYIESKLRATGPADLLLDLNKYRSGLSGDNAEYYSKIEEIKHLAEDYGWDIHFKNEVDIVQCALLQPKNSYLHYEGIQLAKESNSKTIYFCPGNSWEKPKDLVMDMPENVTAVSLTTSSLNHATDRCSEHRVLVYPYPCDGKNHIGEVDMRYRSARRSFNAPDGSGVVMLKVSPSCDRFLSAHCNGSVNVWSLSSADTPPPSMRQKVFTSFYCDTRTTASLSFSHKRKVTCASFSSNGKMVISTSEDSSAHVWNIENDTTVNTIQISPSLPYAISCSFVSGDKLIAYACQNFQIFFHDLHSPIAFSMNALNKGFGSLICLLPVTDEEGKLLIVQEKAVHLFSCGNQTLMHRRVGERLLQYDQASIRRVSVHLFETEKISCAAYAENHRLLLGTNQGCQLFLDVFNSNCSSITFNSGRVNAVDMIDDRVLFVGDGSMKLCWPHLNKKYLSEKAPSIAHVGWNSRNDSVFITASSTGEIRVYHDGKLVYDETNLHKRPSIVRHHGDYVLMGTLDGEVVLIDTVSKRKHPIREARGDEVVYLSVETDENILYIVGLKGDNKYSIEIFNQYFNQYYHLKLYEGISAPVVRTFISIKHSCLIIVLRDYSVLAYNLKNPTARLSMVHEGRISATVTDACFSDKKSMLILTDLEKCYHIFELKWLEPSVSKNIINDTLNMTSLRLPLSEYETAKKPVYESSDEVDGIRVSSLSNNEIEVPLDTFPLTGPSLCCCICPEENFVAIGCENNVVMIYDINKRKVMNKFQVLSNRQTGISQLKFSTYDVNIRKFDFKLILFVVTDFLSLWDISPLIEDNVGFTERAVKCIGCVNASGNPLLELAINDSCTKFGAFDKNLSYFLWNIWEDEI